MSVNTSGSRHSLSQVSLSSQPNSSNNGSQSGTKGKSNKSSSKRSNTSTKDDVQSAANLPLEACSLAIPITSSFSKAGGSGKQGFRFSLRRMLYNSPLVVQRRARSLSGGNNLGAGGGNPVPSGSTAGSTGALKKKQSTSSSRYESESHSDASSSSQSEFRAPSRSLRCAISESENWECPLCLAECTGGEEFFPQLLSCSHRSCLDCLQQYLRIEISESRVNISCPECSEPMHPNDIRMILNNEGLLEKYEEYMLRRVLAAEPDARWCPAPDCNFAVLATGCASCPRLLCQRPGCGSSFCYHCKALWHPNLTCDAARAQRSSIYGSTTNFKNTPRDDIKPCPRCQVLIAKMDDGSCNHMTCALCGSEFCWLCMKEISDLHYLSPSGCTFWGKKPWSRKKKILWQLGTLVGAPVGIALLAGIAVPAMIIGIPIWVGRKLYARFKTTSKHKRNILISSGVAASVLVAPAIAGVAVGVGVPILLAYIYGVVPVSLCQNGVCGVSTSPLGVRIDFDEEDNVTIGAATASQVPSSLLGDGTSDKSGAGTDGLRGKLRGRASGAPVNSCGGESGEKRDTVSLDASNNMVLVGNPSIGEGSVALSASGSASLGSASQLYLRGGDRGESDREDCESASQIGLAGSIMSASRRQLEVQADLASITCSPNKRSSFASSETASATISLSERSAGGLSNADDGAASVASTRALAGSILSYKMGDTGSVHSYRHGGGFSVSASGSVKSGYVPIEVHSSCGLTDGEMVDIGTATGRSSSPISNMSLSGDELTLPPGLVSQRRSARRAPRFAAAEMSDEHGQVRFDDHVSYIDRSGTTDVTVDRLYTDLSSSGFRTPPEDSEST